MQIRILKPGMLSTLQDMGRINYLSQAVPISGTMDTLSARIANLVVGNADTAALIEFTYAATEFLVEADSLIAYSGNGATLFANKQKLICNRPIFIPAGTHIKLITNTKGARTYLSIAGGWKIAEVLGSKSTFLTAAIGGFEGRSLKVDDVLAAEEFLTPVSKRILHKLTNPTINHSKWYVPMSIFHDENHQIIRVVPAQEFTWFSGKSIIDFLSTPFTVGLSSNRMGYYLEGATINKTKKTELLSTAVTPGTIQVTGDGKMIILMADCQTTGGYPRIAQIASVDIHFVAQMKPGDSIQFSEISKDEAEILYIEREKLMLSLVNSIESLL